MRYVRGKSGVDRDPGMGDDNERLVVHGNSWWEVVWCGILVVRYGWEVGEDLAGSICQSGVQRLQQ